MGKKSNQEKWFGSHGLFISLIKELIFKAKDPWNHRLWPPKNSFSAFELVSLYCWASVIMPILMALTVLLNTYLTMSVNNNKEIMLITYMGLCNSYFHKYYIIWFILLALKVTKLLACLTTTFTQRSDKTVLHSHIVFLDHTALLLPRTPQDLMKAQFILSFNHFLLPLQLKGYPQFLHLDNLKRDRTLSLETRTVPYTLFCLLLLSLL